jgi:NitT/TauT family transport system permease protein
VLQLFESIIASTIVTMIRVFALILLSIISGWLLGYVAVKSKLFESIYITLTEIFESVPVFTFFPVALIFFVNGIGGYLGVELAADFLVFTAVVWNIWMGIYQAFKTIPKEMQEVIENYRFTFLNKMLKLYIPFSIPRIVANVYPSFASALFYITVSEVFSIGNTSFSSFGIGSEIYYFSVNNDIEGLTYSLITLTIFIILITYGIKRMEDWALSKYTVDTEYIIARRGKPRFRYTVIFNAIVNKVNPIQRIVKYRARRAPIIYERERGEGRKISIVGRVSLVLILFLIVYFTLISISFKDLIPYVLQTPFYIIGLGYDLVRIGVVTLFSTSISIFLGYLFATKLKKFERPFVFIIQVLASLPAPVYFPILYGILIHHLSFLGSLTPEFFVLMLAFLSTAWYVIYNYYIALKSIPYEYWEIMDNFSMSLIKRLRLVVIPSTMPYLITGIISTVNGAWGGLILGEYWQNIYDSQTLQVTHGIMKYLDLAVNAGSIVEVSWISFVLSIFIAVYAILATKRGMDLARKRYTMEEGIFAA